MRKPKAPRRCMYRLMLTCRAVRCQRAIRHAPPHSWHSGKQAHITWTPPKWFRETWEGKP